MRNKFIQVLFLSILISCSNFVLAEDLRVKYPEDFASGWAPYIGKTVVFDQVLYVCNTAKYADNVILSYRRQVTPDEWFPLGTNEFIALKEENSRSLITLRDRNLTTFSRKGLTISQLRAKVTGENYLEVYKGEEVVYQGGRPTQHDPIGDATIKVCAMNIQYYCPVILPGGLGGPKTEAEVIRQKEKIVKALIHIDADILALCELQNGQESLQTLRDALNQELGSDVYAFLDDNDIMTDTYTKVGFFYKKEKVRPYKALAKPDITSMIYSRRLYVQAFEEIANGERFILSLNHFKSKSGGSPDQGNSTRVTNAGHVISYLQNNAPSYFEDTDVLVVGDLNAYSQEEPLRMFYEKGFSNELLKYNPDSYSYVFSGQVGHLDHALASATMSGQITGAVTYHINTDEPYNNGYVSGTDNTMYRCSDHDPVIIGLKLQEAASVEDQSQRSIDCISTATGCVFRGILSQAKIQIMDLSGRVIAWQEVVDSQEVEISSSGVFIIFLQEGSQQRVFKVIR